MQNAEQIQAEIRQHCIRTEPYKGYRSSWCSDGTVVFVGPKGDEVKGSSGNRDGWMEPAWIAAKAEIDKRTAALGQ